MAHVVIIGGGTAGLPTAYELAEIAREGERITVVADCARFRPGAAAAWITAQGSTEFDLALNLKRHGIGFTPAGARRVHPERRQLELGDGRLLDYDLLVIAAGPRPAFEEIDGFGPRGYTQSLCHAEHVAGCLRDWNRFVADPGPIVVGAVQGATCLGPAYESALLMDHELRARGLRERAPMTFVTPEPWIGHLGVGGIGDSRERLERALRERGIAWIAGARVERVEHERMHVSGSPGGGARAVPFRYAMLMPPFRGIEAVAGIEGLADERGFIIVDEYLRNPRFPEIYAAGVTVTSAAASAPEAAAQSHRTPYMIGAMVNAVTRNIRDALDGRVPGARAEWAPVQLADLGASGLAFVGDPAAALQPAHGVAAGDWVQMSRCSACELGR